MLECIKFNQKPLKRR